jgi:hypothetical protein
MSQENQITTNASSGNEVREEESGVLAIAHITPTKDELLQRILNGEFFSYFSYLPIRLPDPEALNIDPRFPLEG